MVDLIPVEHDPFAGDLGNAPPPSEWGRLPEWLGRVGGVVRGAGSALGEDIGNLAEAMSPQGYLENYRRLIGDQPNAPAAFRNPSDQPMAAPSPADIAGFLTMHLAGGAPADTLSAGIRAYHGSPHDFPAFDATKIGTGEGAQTYGHGLYFGGREATAQRYREDLAGPATYSLVGSNDDVIATGSPTQLGMTMGDRLRNVVPAGAPYLGNSIGRLWGEGKPIDVNSVAKEAWGGLLDDPQFFTSDLRMRIEEAIAAAKPILEQHRIATTQPRRTYEVNLDVDPEHLLDWDKPLSEQSEHVKKVLRELPWGEPYAASNTLTGGQIVPKTVEGAEQLRAAGIPGIRYLDQGSRAAGEGSHNYVIFDDKLIDILKKYGLGGLVAGGALALGGNAEAATHAVPVDHLPDFGP
jgi:hypothetical protein